MVGEQVKGLPGLSGGKEANSPNSWDLWGSAQFSEKKKIPQILGTLSAPFSRKASASPLPQDGGAKLARGRRASKAPYQTQWARFCAQYAERDMAIWRGRAGLGASSKSLWQSFGRVGLGGFGPREDPKRSPRATPSKRGNAAARRPQTGQKPTKTEPSRGRKWDRLAELWQGLGWPGLAWPGLRWAGLGWAELSWAKLGWASWPGLRSGQTKPQSHPLKTGKRSGRAAPNNPKTE